MGLFTYALAGFGFILIGAWDSIISTVHSHRTPKTTPSSSSSSSVTFFSISLLSLSFILNSLISLYSALNSQDDVGLVLQLSLISISSLFLLYSILGLITHFSNSIFIPPPLLNLLSLFAFVEEFLLFYLQRKDKDGIENRYYDLFLLPVGICIFSALLELKSPDSSNARLCRGIGLISQGFWVIQMGFSFYSGSFIANGCSLHEKSRGNYTIKCGGHMEYHRGRAIATLQFNVQLAVLVVLITGAYSVVCKVNRIEKGVGETKAEYKPIGAEMLQLDDNSRFTLDSDDDEEGNVGIEKGIVVVTESSGVNGYASH